MSSERHRNNEEYRDNAPRSHRQPRFPSIADEIVTLSEKVVFPVDDYPGYNFIGKLLGPKGSTLKGLVLSTKSKISILGKGSSKDKAREEEMSKSDDPEHAHFKEPLHVLVQVKGPKITAHRRIAAALKELNHYMVPQRDDRQEQMEERPFVNEGEIARPVGRGPQAPIIRVGIPPPGAVILGEEPQRGESRRGRPEPPLDSYTPVSYYEGRRATDYDRYPEPQDTQRYDYPEDRDSYARVEKRSVPSNGYSTQRYKEENYDDPYSR